MKALLYYLSQVLVTSGILYAWYHFALRNKKFHRYNRFYLLAATVISITIPFLNIPVYFTQTETDSSFVLQTLTVISFTGSDNPVTVIANQSHHINWISWQNLSYSFYLLIASITLLRIIISLIKVRRIVKNNPVEKLDNIHFVNSNEPGTPFSFFRWLFWNRKIELRSEKGEQIFRHELFHIKQKHSWDIIYMELLNVIIWINPFFYLMKKEVKAIHEFLADQFAITENTKWQYAELLLMQVLNTEERLVNPFFHNQIKRRIAMITTSKKPSYQYVRKLMALPVSLVLLILFAFTYKTKRNVQQTKDNEQAVVLTDSAISNNDLIIKDNVTIKDKNGKSLYLPNATMIYKGSDSKDTSADLLVYIDGKLFPELKRISDIDKKIKPADVEMIRVLKGKNATDKYGEKGKNGVMEIITKENKKLEEIKKSMLRDTNISDTTKPGILNDNKIFDKVETPPSFPGGEAKWIQYLEKNLDVSAPAKKHAPDGAYTVIIEFIVDKEGKISDIKSLTYHAYGMEEEAMRVIRLGPRWIPAMQNGQQVNAYKRQIITFVVGKEEKNLSSGVKTTGNEAVVMVGSSQDPKNKFLSIPENIAEWNEDLLVVDGKIIGKIKDNMENAGLVNSVHVTLLGPKNAIEKYGEQGKDGAWEAYTLKSNAEVYRNDTNINKPRVGSIDLIFDEVETPPSFPGGVTEWKKYLAKNINATLPLDSGVPAGIYKIIVQFIVHEDGSLSDIKAKTKYGYGMENEAMRVIKMGPKWIPAKQDGRIVQAYAQQPITFAISEEDGDSKQNSLQPTTTISPGIPKITVAELKKASVHKLLQLPEGTEIISFIFTIDTEGGDIITIPGNGSSFNYKIRNLINTAKPGRLITFDMILINKDGQQKKMSSKAYAVTD